MATFPNNFLGVRRQRPVPHASRQSRRRPPRHDHTHGPCRTLRRWPLHRPPPPPRRMVTCGGLPRPREHARPPPHPPPSPRTRRVRSAENCPSGTVTASGENGPNEIAARAFDANPSTKWLDFGGSDGTAWLQIRFGESTVVSRYRLVSANDAPERDPKSWRLVVDGTAVEEKTGVYFSARGQAKTFQLASPAPGQTYRLDVLDLRNTSAANSVQLADLVLLCGVPAVREGGPVACPGHCLVANRREGGGGEGCIGRGGGTPLQGALRMPSHCHTGGKCQPQWLLQ